MGWFSQPITLTLNLILTLTLTITLTVNPNPNQAGHGLKHFTILAIEQFEENSKSIRHMKESTWQHLLQTAHPLGINNLQPRFFYSNLQLELECACTSMGWFSQPITLTLNLTLTLSLTLTLTLTFNPYPTQAGHGLKHFTILAIEQLEENFKSIRHMKESTWRHLL